MDRGQHHAAARVVEQRHGPREVAAHVGEGVVPHHRQVPQRRGQVGTERGHLAAQCRDVLGHVEPVGGPAAAGAVGGDRQRCKGDDEGENAQGGVHRVSLGRLPPPAGQTTPRAGLRGNMAR